mmetsp:Transcript_11315/g.23722  ORF Transcript_11315/g.23722 Transcript_11315/m.23722 type:complete len:134 (-) Transcript_11315:37-438(-)
MSRRSTIPPTEVWTGPEDHAATTTKEGATTKKRRERRRRRGFVEWAAVDIIQFLFPGRFLPPAEIVTTINNGVTSPSRGGNEDTQSERSDGAFGSCSALSVHAFPLGSASPKRPTPYARARGKRKKAAIASCY